MAKRYETFDEIRAYIGDQEKVMFKPGGTMGSHCMEITRMPGSPNDLVVFGSASGAEVIPENIPVGTIGYDCGNIWNIPSPEEYRDPIRQVLARAKVSQKALMITDEPITYRRKHHASFSWSSHDSNMGDFAYVLGDGDDKEVGWNQAEARTPYDVGASCSDRQIVGGEAIVIESVMGYQETTLSQRYVVTKVVVRPDADKQKVYTWLFELLTPEGKEEKKRREQVEEK